MQTYTCANCGRQFQDYASNRTKSKDGAFCCSVKCKGEYQTRLAVARAPIKSSSVCSKCGQKKPASEFYRDSKSRANGGLSYLCKSCVKTERQIHYDENSAAINARVIAYKKNNPGRTGKFWDNEPGKRAQSLLNREVKAGRIQKPDKCQRCGEKRKLHAHHYAGYDHPLTVIWVCVPCHHFLHGRGPETRKLMERP